MAQEFTVSLQAIIDECKLEVIHTPQDLSLIHIFAVDNGKKSDEIDRLNSQLSVQSQVSQTSDDQSLSLIHI